MGSIVSSVGKAIFGSPPEPDRNIGKAARENAALSREMAAVARDELKFNRERSARIDPVMLEAMDLEMDLARTGEERSAQQWQRYLDTFSPVEDRMVQDAMTYDSPERMEQMATRAQADVRAGLDATMSAGKRDLMRRGVNPASGAYAAATTDVAHRGAAAEADARNRAREGVRDKGIALRSGAASFGRNMPNTAGQNLALGMQGGAAASDAARTAALTPGAATGQAMPWFSGATGANSSSAQIGLGLQDARFRNYAAVNEMTAGLIGDIAMGAGYAFSSEEMKEEKEPVKADLILKGLEEIPVEAWKYKKGMGDSGKHIGPYAEDVQEQFGDGAAPGGEMLDLVSMNGIALAGIQALAKKVKKLEKAGLDTVGSRAKRDTEPRRVA